MFTLRSPTQSTGKKTAQKDVVIGTAGQINHLAPGKVGDTSETKDAAEVFSSNLKEIIKEVEYMGEWLSENPNSRTGLREFVVRANRGLCKLMEVSDMIQITNKNVVVRNTKLTETCRNCKEIKHKKG